MIDIQQALYNVQHSRYGREVRTSIHDAIYQIDQNANEALANARTMGVGTAVDSPTSSTEGYVEGNLYLNSNTWDLWQCVGENSWLNTGNVKGDKGDKGTDGVSNYIYIRYSAYYDGTDFTATPTASSQFIGIYYGSKTTAPTNKEDYQWTSYVGAAGTSAYVHIRYSEYADGTNFVSEPTPACKYIGIYAGSSSSAPANKSYYTWSQYVGKDGMGSGDMSKSEYAQQGVPATVDKALWAKEADSATDATNAENLKKSNGEILDVDTVTTKLQTIDEQIDDGFLQSKNIVNPYDVLFQTLDGTPNANRFSIWVKCEPETEYTYSAQSKHPSISEIDLFEYSDFKGTMIVNRGKIDTATTSFITEAQTQYLVIYGGGTAITVDMIKACGIQVEKGIVESPIYVENNGKSNRQITEELQALLLRKADSYSEAINNAKSHLIFNFEHFNGYNYWNVQILVPVALINSTPKIFINGYYYNSSSFGEAQVKLSKTAISEANFYYNGSAVTQAYSLFYV